MTESLETTPPRSVISRSFQWTDAGYLGAAFSPRRTAGAMLGTLVAKRLRGEPAFDPAYRAAAELALAGMR